MLLELNINPEILSGLVLVLGVCTALYYKRNKILNLLCKWRIYSLLQDSNMVIHIVTSSEEWETISPHFKEDAYAFGALGFDCEWIQVQGKRRPVALLQLATASGVCILVRLSCMKYHIPASLKNLLDDEKVLKLGVGCIQDSEFLLMDYGLTVRGCVDLRHLYFAYANPKLQRDNSFGLNGLSQKLLGKSLDKDWRIRGGDWEACELTRRQIKYAAEDALVGIHILIKCLEDKLSQNMYTAYIISSSYWKTYIQQSIQQYCCYYSDLDFRYPKNQDLDNKAIIITSNQQNRTRESNSITVIFKKSSPNKTKKDDEISVMRKTNLPRNCQLLAPDNTLLTKINHKKADWYVENSLGIIVSDHPLVVKLKFEPARRPQTEFYRLKRHRMCVVCGKEDSVIRENIVPLEVRRYFPAILKSHQNHNVVQLCSQCHQKSSVYDTSLRICLTKEFNAPIGTNSDLTHIVDQDLKRVQIAGGILLKKGSKLSSERIAGLEQVLKDHYKCGNITTNLMKTASKLEIKIPNINYEPHGLKVYREYEKIGITKFERRCREHFLSTMNPKFMPEHKSIDHHEYEMELRMNRLPQDHPQHKIYKIALVGTEGNLDKDNYYKLHKENVPYNTIDTCCTPSELQNMYIGESSDEN